MSTVDHYSGVDHSQHNRKWSTIAILRYAWLYRRLHRLYYIVYYIGYIGLFIATSLHRYIATNFTPAYDPEYQAVLSWLFS